MRNVWLNRKTRYHEVEYNDPHKLPQTYVVFLLLCELTWSAISGSQKVDSHKWPTVLFNEIKGHRAISRYVCVDHCSLLLQHLSTQMHFITKGYKRFSKTNSTDPRQRVPFKTYSKKSWTGKLTWIWILRFGYACGHHKVLWYTSHVIVYRHNPQEVLSVVCQLVESMTVWGKQNTKRGFLILRVSISLNRHWSLMGPSNP